MGPGDDKSKRQPTGPLELIGTVAGIAAGASVFVYLVGGAVMWARYAHAHLPASRALAVTPREVFVTVGLSELVVPCLVFAAVLTVAFASSRLVSGPPLGRSGAILLGCGVLVVAVAYALPFDAVRSVGTIALVAAFAYALWENGELRAEHEPQPAFRPLRIVLVNAAIVAVLLVTLQLFGTTQLDRATVTRIGGHRVSGTLVSSTADAVYLGRRRTILAVPSRKVDRLLVAGPASYGGTAKSYLERALSPLLP